MISAQLEKILQYAYTRARAQQQEFIGVEHLLLALMERSDDVAEILNGVGVDFALLSEQLASSIIENTPTVPQHLMDRWKPSRRWVSSACYSGRWCMCSRPIKMKCRRWMCWWR